MKGKTIIITTTLALLMIVTVLADTYLGVGVSSTEDIYANIDLFSEGDIYYTTNMYSDNIHYDGPVINEGGGGMNQMDVAKLIKYSSDIVILNGHLTSEDAKHKSADQLGLSHQPRDVEIMVAQSLDQAFLTNKEGNQLYQLLQNLNMRLEAVESTMTEMAGELYCEHKIDITKKYGLESVDCGETTYHVDIPNFEAIGVKLLPLPTEEEENITVSLCPPGKTLCEDQTCKYTCFQPKKGIIEPEEICVPLGPCYDDNGLQDFKCHEKGYTKWYERTRLDCTECPPGQTMLEGFCVNEWS